MSYASYMYILHAYRLGVYVLYEPHSHDHGWIWVRNNDSPVFGAMATLYHLWVWMEKGLWRAICTSNQWMPYKISLEIFWRDVMASVPVRQGDNEDQLEIIRWTKKEFPKMQVIGGNVATYLWIELWHDQYCIVTTWDIQNNRGICYIVLFPQARGTFERQPWIEPSFEVTRWQAKNLLAACLIVLQGYRYLYMPRVNLPDTPT